MSRRAILINIVLLGVLVVALLAALAIGLSRGFTIGAIRTGELKPAYEQTFSADRIARVSLGFASMDVEVYTTDEKDIRVIQLAAGNLSADDLVTVNAFGSTLSVAQRNRTFFGFLHFRPYQVLKLYLPRDYADDLAVTTSSGNVTLLNDVSLRSIDLQMTSGDFQSDYAISSKQFNLTLTSGDIRLNSVSCETYQIHSTSGNIRVASLDGAGTVTVTSGDTSIDMLRGTSHSIRTTSGKIAIGSFSGSGNLHTSSGTITAAITELNGSLSVDATSGDIRITAGQGLSFDLLASCVSGSVRGTLPMSVSNNGKAASASIGSTPHTQLTVQTTSGNITIDQGK